MNCPICNIPLQIAERQGVEIDFCQQCRGVWLDRGELDKIIERSASELPSRSNPERYDDRHGQHYEKQHDDHHDNRQYKKRSFLQDLFD